LGYRPPNYKPDMRDYRSYVAVRSRFLLSARGRAALLYGGIIGRLARSEVSSEEVLRGPSDDVLIDGICLWDGHSAAAYWDDRLTGEEIDLICGVYHVATGKYYFPFAPIKSDHTFQVNMTVTSKMANKRLPCPGGPDLIHLPSGINFGWWTPMWETWYQKRLRQLENGPGTLATHTQWKHNLKLERRAPRILKPLKNVLQIFLLLYGLERIFLEVYLV
ncbi:hypothetical protein B0H13DRAFT_1663399, partial [Mycena leptocephala]